MCSLLTAILLGAKLLAAYDHLANVHSMHMAQHGKLRSLACTSRGAMGVQFA